MKWKRSKGLKKILSLSVLFSLMVSVFSVSYVLAATTISVSSSKWKSDSYKAGYWSSDVMVRCVNSSSSFAANSYVSTAISAWDAVGIVDCSYTSSASSANITFYSGTRAQMKALGFGYDSCTNGVTTWDSYTLKAQDSSYKIYKITAASASMCSDYSYDSALSSSNETKLYKNVATHELGHALGWMGHSASTSAVMYEYTSLITTLTSTDKNHLIYVYGLME